MDQSNAVASRTVVRGAARTTRTTRTARLARMALVVVAGLGLAGCNNAGEGAFSGAAIGALGGLAIGSLSGNAGEGAAIGAVSGAVAGGVIGDQNARNAPNRAANRSYGNYDDRGRRRSDHRNRWDDGRDW